MLRGKKTKVDQLQPHSHLIYMLNPFSFCFLFFYIHMKRILSLPHSFFRLHFTFIFIFLFFLSGFVAIRTVSILSVLSLLRGYHTVGAMNFTTGAFPTSFCFFSTCSIVCDTLYSLCYSYLNFVLSLLPFFSLFLSLCSLWSRSEIHWTTAGWSEWRRSLSLT